MENNLNPVQKIGKSIVGMFFGILLFIGSFVVLFMNEGRDDLSLYVKKAISVESLSDFTGTAEQLVAVEGKWNTDQYLTDTYVKTGKYISLNRNVEMFSRVEEKESETDDNGNTTETYNYTKEWASDPADSSEFNTVSGHENPKIAMESFSQTVTNINIGKYFLNSNGLELPGSEDLLLDNIVKLEFRSKEKLAQGKFIFMGTGTFDNPAIGDIRISYSIVPVDRNVTIIGGIKSNEIVTNIIDEHTFFRAFYGNKAQAIQTLHQEYKTQLWIFRILGFVMMWIGLNLILGLIRTLFNFIPFLGQITGGILTAITGIVAAVLSFVTILLGIILHSRITLIVVILAACGTVYYQYFYAKKTSKSKTQ